MSNVEFYFLFRTVNILLGWEGGEYVFSFLDLNQFFELLNFKNRTLEEMKACSQPERKLLWLEGIISTLLRTLFQRVTYPEVYAGPLKTELSYQRAVQSNAVM